MCFPDVKTRGRIDPVSALQMMGQPGFDSGFQVEVAEGSQVSQTLTVRRSRPGETNEVRPGYLIRLHARIHQGLAAKGLLPPMDMKGSHGLNTPSGWMGWTRLLGQLHTGIGWPLFTPEYARFLNENLGIIVEVLGSDHKKIPDMLRRKVREMGMART